MGSSRLTTLLLVLALAAALVAMLLLQQGGPAPGSPAPPRSARDADSTPDEAHSESERVGLTVEAAGPAPAPAGERIRVTGCVRAAHSHAVVAGARIVCDPGQAGAEAETDANGTYSLTAARTGHGLVLVVRHASYLVSGGEVTDEHVHEGEASLDFDLVPAPQGSEVSGRVLGTDNAAVAGARVRLVDDVLGRGRADQPAATTDADGKFRLAAVAPGTHALQVTADRFEDFVQAGVRVPPASRLDLGALRLVAFAWSRVVGTVTASGGAPLEGVTVVIREFGWAELRTETDAAGRYALERVPPGRHRLRCERADRFVFARTLEVPAGRTLQADLVLPVGDHFVGGRVEVGGEPAAGFEVVCADAAGTGFDHVARAARVQADGSFRLDGLTAAEPVQLNFTLQRPYTVFESEPVPVDRDDHRFAFAAAATTVTVHGTVRDQGGGPLAGALVAPPAGGPETRAMTDGSGYYRIRVEVSNGSAVAVTAARAGYREQARSVSLGGAASGEVVLDFTLHSLEQTGTVSGLVTDGQDRPVQRALVACLASAFRATTHTDSGGRFVFERVVPGSLSFRIHHADHVDAREERELAAAGQLEVRVRLREAARVAQEIEVLGEADVPVADIEVSASVKGAFVAARRTDRLGRATFVGMLAADAVFTVQPPGYPRHERRCTLAADSGLLTLRLRQGPHRIAGTVTDADLRARKEVDVLLHGAERAGTRVFAVGHTDAHGHFAFDLLPAGDYRVEAWSAAGHGAADARSGDQAVRLVLR